MTVIFSTVKSLYEDMTAHYQSFVKSEDGTGIEGATPYRLVELKRDRLEFHSNKFGGASLYISGNIVNASRNSFQGNAISEYVINIEGAEEPLVLMACKQR